MDRKRLRGYLLWENLRTSLCAGSLKCLEFAAPGTSRTERGATDGMGNEIRDPKRVHGGGECTPLLCVPFTLGTGSFPAEVKLGWSTLGDARHKSHNKCKSVHSTPNEFSACSLI